jgi:hypothetical protein
MQRNRRQSHEGQVRLAVTPTFLRQLNSYQKVQVLVCPAAYIEISLIRNKNHINNDYQRRDPFQFREREPPCPL